MKYQHGHALIVGVGADLPNTIDDAKGLADILKDPDRCAYPATQVALLTSEQATRETILAGLNDLAKTADKDASVVVYFSGHGYRVTTSTGPAYYLMPYGYNINRLYQTAISGGEFTDALQAIPAGRLVVLLDCCHAGGMDEAKAPGLELSKAALPPEAGRLFGQGKGRVIIASSQEDELSYAGKPYSAFTLALMEAFSGVGAAKKDGYVRVTDLALHAREVVPGRTRNRQHPILQFEQADNFILAYYAAGAAEPKGLPFEEEPQIEPEAGAFTAGTVFDQRGQTVNQQTNVSGNVGFLQPGWTVQGNVNQAQRDLYVGAQKPVGEEKDEDE